MIDQQRHNRIVQHVLAGRSPDASGGFGAGRGPGSLFFDVQQPPGFDVGKALGPVMIEGRNRSEGRVQLVSFDLYVEVATVHLIRPIGIEPGLATRIFEERRQIAQYNEKSKYDQDEPDVLQHTLPLFRQRQMVWRIRCPTGHLADSRKYYDRFGSKSANLKLRKHVRFGQKRTSALCL